MILLSRGTLPLTRFLALHAKIRGDEAREVLDVMRRSLARFGANDNKALEAMLAAYGFAWTAADKAPDAGMQEAIDSVQAALGGKP